MKTFAGYIFLLVGVLVLAFLGRVERTQADGTIPAMPRFGWVASQIPEGEHAPGVPFIQRWIITPYDVSQPVETDMLFVLTYPQGLHIDKVDPQGSGGATDLHCATVGKQVFCVAERLTIQNDLLITLTPIDGAGYDYWTTIQALHDGGLFASGNRVIIQANRLYLPWIDGAKSYIYDEKQ